MSGRAGAGKVNTRVPWVFGGVSARESDVECARCEECSANLRDGTVCVSISLVGKALTRESRRGWAASASSGLR